VNRTMQPMHVSLWIRPDPKSETKAPLPQRD
jgi:hypothetical protein